MQLPVIDTTDWIRDDVEADGAEQKAWLTASSDSDHAGRWLLKPRRATRRCSFRPRAHKRGDERGILVRGR